MGGLAAPIICRNGHSGTPHIYVAGPYRAPTPAHVAFNIKVARDFALKIAARGYFPVTPHLNTAQFDVQLPQRGDAFWLEGAMRLLRQCDAIFMLPGWAASIGACAELEVAELLHVPVVWHLDGLPKRSEITDQIEEGGHVADDQ